METLLAILRYLNWIGAFIDKLYVQSKILLHTIAGEETKDRTII